METLTAKVNTPKGWQKQQIKDLLNYERPDRYIVESDKYISKGTPVLTANKSFILGYTDEKEGIYDNLPVIVFDDFTTDSKFVDFPFKIKSSAIKLLKNKEGVNLRFVYEKMKSVNFPTGSHKRFYISQYQDMEILVPPVREQEKIAEILTTLDEEIQKTDEIISATERLKTGLLRQLFDLKGETSKLNEVATLITKGTTPTTYGHAFTDEGINFFKIENIDESGNINLSSCKHISSDTHQFLRRSQLMPGDVLFSIAGALGRIAVINESHVPANINQAIAIIRLKDTSDARFVSQVLKTDYVMRQVIGSSVQLAQANISLGKLGDITLPWPSKKERERISNVIQSIDEKVAVNKKVKGRLSLLKKGLMQDLLTGKKRTI